MNRNHFLRIVLVLTISLTGPAMLAAEEHTSINGIEPPASVLFVGNSFTFYNNAIYTHLRGLLVAEDPANRRAIFLKSMTISGARLGDHRGGLEQMLASREWDIIVLQGRSREAIDKEMAPGFEAAGREFSTLIRERGATPVLFMTWAYADRPEMTPELAAAFDRLGAELGMVVIPVGLAFERARLEIEGVSLHSADRIHPALEGTYLAAAVFYAALFGRNPERLDYTAGLGETLAGQLRSIAWRTTRAYYDSAGD